MDAYAAIKQNRLKYLRLNKKKLRADLYQNLQDAIAASDTSAAAIGQRIILPSSFIVGPRHMVQNYQDAMVICKLRLLHSLAIPNGLKSRKRCCSDSNLRIDPIW